ncbi:CDP-alcohol phosphatidyltransferase [Alsobacter soli]|uniref:CDP-diacylglycerol--glycerol-3-phosphate 3-phosphatidyltransferase n=1 Tax=Alsobacter soli TaxID=2109933 RepID=A0A2T1HUU1_9HYPH|nr:CDP-alcohol phosphatidyltransferase family protein [Alsobacter soli]PSC05289.1 CDP-alcohol phosphatidyltransferase [Alsobacter soli]
MNYLPNLPNLITIGRFLLVPFVVAMIGQSSWGLAFAGFVIAGVSDGLDGWIARRFDMRSELGAYMDPLADKALLICIYVSLAVVGQLPAWLAIVVVSRDVMIMGAVVLSWLLSKPIAINPSYISKANTLAQIAFAALILWSLTYGVDDSLWLRAGMLLVASLTIISAGAYLARWLKHMAS